MRPDGDGEEVVRSDEDPVATEDREFVDVLLGRAEWLQFPTRRPWRTQALARAADQAGRGDPPIRPASWVQDGFRRPAGPGTGAA
jgi:hypothetical protein